MKSILYISAGMLFVAIWVAPSAHAYLTPQQVFTDYAGSSASSGGFSGTGDFIGLPNPFISSPPAGLSSSLNPIVGSTSGNGGGYFASSAAGSTGSNSSYGEGPIIINPDPPSSIDSSRHDESSSNRFSQGSTQQPAVDQNPPPGGTLHSGAPATTKTGPETLWIVSLLMIAAAATQVLALKKKRVLNPPMRVRHE